MITLMKYNQTYVFSPELAAGMNTSTRCTAGCKKAKEAGGCKETQNIQ
jgi:hypothetical protein